MRLGTIVKLIVASLAVGLLMAFFNITPMGVYRGLLDGIVWLWDEGVEAFGNYGAVILAGASIVVPLWLLNQALKRRRRERG